MAHCVISAVYDTDVDQMMPACVVHAAYAPCPLNGQHRELAAALRSCRAAVVLSGYSSPLYSDLYGDWHLTIMSSFTTQGGAAKATTEVLWSNREPIADLFAGGAA